MSDPLDAFLDEAFAVLSEATPEPSAGLRDRLRRLAAIRTAPARRVTIFIERQGKEYRMVRREESGDDFALPVAAPSLTGSRTIYQRYYYREEE